MSKYCQAITAQYFQTLNITSRCNNHLEAEWSRVISCFITTDGRYSHTLASQGHHIKDHNSSSSNLVDLAMHKVTSSYSRIHNYSQLKSIKDDMTVDYI